MQVCLASLHPRVLSGQIDSLAGLGRALKRRGHDVRLVAPFEADGLLTHALTTLDTGPRGMAGAAKDMLLAVPRIVKASAEADVLHLALPTPAFGWVADAVQLQTKTPLVVTFEGHLADGAETFGAIRRLPRNFKSRLPLWAVNNGLFARMSLHAAQHYIVSSEYQRQELVELGLPADRTSVITNIVEASKLEECDPRAARAELGLPQGRPIVGYVGHFNDVKGVDVLAKAFASLAKSNPDVQLALAWSGQGDARPIRRHLAGLEDRVTWLGKVSVGAFLCGIDVLALPYRSTAGQGAFPSLVLEALHMGRPLVTTALPLLEEIAMGEDIALLCPPDQPEALANQLIRLLADPALRLSMSQQQVRMARQRFAADRVAPHYEALYRWLLERDESAEGVVAA